MRRRAVSPPLLAVLAVPLLAGLCAPPAVRGAGPATSPSRTITLGIVPYFTAEKLYQLYDPFIKHLAENTPYRWELRLGKTHDELVSSLCSGEVSVAFLGPMPFSKALASCGARPLLLTLGPDGKPDYHAVIATADPGIAALRDLRGKKVALFEKSTASHYLPLKMLAAEGITRKDFDAVPYGSQDKIVTALLGNEVAAGGIKESLFEKFKGSGLRALKVSEPLPQFVFAVGPRSDPALEKAFSAALLKLRPLARPADRALMTGWDPELANGFAEPAPGFPDEVRALARSIEPFLR
jgi:ABC-type phosphate/phosphonate transport system substrate-binding protein